MPIGTPNVDDEKKNCCFFSKTKNTQASKHASTFTTLIIHTDAEPSSSSSTKREEISDASKPEIAINFILFRNEMKIGPLEQTKPTKPNRIVDELNHEKESRKTS